MRNPRYPSLYQINTRVWLNELSRPLGRPGTLDDIPDAELDRMAARGFDWIWLLSVWQTGPAGQQLSRGHPEWRREFRETLPDLRDEDIVGSGFAITAYAVHEALGGEASLARLRARLRQRGLRLMLDFVPNHTGLDHPWVEEQVDYYVRGTEQDLADEPGNYTRLPRREGPIILAHGRDPYFVGWPDTLQIDYSNPAAQEAMRDELLRIAGQCDGVRCDMAMLVLPEVFERTWGRCGPAFWPEAIRRVRDRVPDFCFLAEVYWDLEWTLQQQGFDYSYDKKLYDRLRAGEAGPVRDHFHAGLDYQNKLVRFLENHDEPRAAVAFAPGQQEAAAVLTFLAPGLRFFHQGQLEGHRKRISAHLVRAPQEAANSRLEQFYGKLLEVLRQPVVRQGQWQLAECLPAWDGNESVNAFIAFAWQGFDDARWLAVVNYAGHASQAYVRLPFTGLGDGRWRLRDRLGDAVYDHDGNELQSTGLYLEVGPWQSHVFEWSKMGPRQN